MSGGIAQLFLNLGTRRGCVVSIMPRPPLPPGKTRYLLYKINMYLYIQRVPKKCTHILRDVIYVKCVYIFLAPSVYVYVCIVCVCVCVCVCVDVVSETEESHSQKGEAKIDECQ